MLNKIKKSILQFSFLVITILIQYSCNSIKCNNPFSIGPIQNQEIIVEEACYSNPRYDLETECDNLYTMVNDYGKDCGYGNFDISSGIKYTQGIVDTTLAIGDCCILFFQTIDYQPF